MSDLERLSFGCEDDGDLWLEFRLGPGGPESGWPATGVPQPAPPEPCGSCLPPSGRVGPTPGGPIPAVAETAAAAMAAADTICGCDGAIAFGEADPS